MADTTVATGLTVQQWDDKFFTEYVRDNRFAKYMGTTEAAMIQVKNDLTKKKGESLTYALVNRLTGNGVTGSNTLEGNEEEMDSRSHKLTVDKIRNAVRVAEIDEQYSAIGLRNAGRVVLKDWMMEKTRDDIIEALGSIRTDAGVIYNLNTAGASQQAALDEWLTNNSDRVLFGRLKSNTETDFDFSDSIVKLTSLGTAPQTASAGGVSLLKRMAKTASPKIRPIKVNGDEEWYVLFCDPYAFRDLKNDATITAANREARVRGMSNPIFTDSDLAYDGVIIREIPEIADTFATYLDTAGASSERVGACFLCGAQAVGVGYAKRTTSQTETFDYGDKVGVAIEEIRGIEKLFFGENATTETTDPVQHGVATWFVGAALDA